MKRLFLMFSMLALLVSAGCQQTPAGDPEFKKDKVNMEELQPTQGEKMQQAPDA